jgi:diadenylate cyclase
MVFEILRAIFDIILTAFVIYGILFLLKGTRAGEIAIGVISLILLYLLSDYFGLASLNWLMGGFIANFLLIIVIIFHPDIRRVLATLGRGARLISSAPPHSSKIIEEVIKAVKAMAEKKIGGIIVLEGNTRLDEHLDVGVKMDADVSKELLLSIFSPQSPLHDGAVVIRDEKISMASCFLPLTKNPQLEKTFGSRHRAGIGITEETDAIAIVVSEERGIISLAKGGMLMMELDENGLRKEISAHFRI